MLKIVATADIHLGAKPYGSEEKKRDIYETFITFLKYCQKTNPDFIIIAGDLFDSKEIDQQTNLIASMLSKFKDKIIFCCGNHDPDLHYFMKMLGVDTSPIRKVKLVKKVLFFTRIDWNQNHNEIRDQITQIKNDYGLSNTILVSHFNLKDKMQYLKNTKNYISYTDVRYFKLVVGGHIHNSFTMKNIIVPGSLDRLDITNVNDRGFYEITISDSGEITDIKFKVIDTRKILVDDNFGKLKKEILTLNQLGKKKPIVFFTGDPNELSGFDLLWVRDRCLIFDFRGKGSKDKSIIKAIDGSEVISTFSLNIKDEVEFYFKKRKVDKELIEIISSTWGSKKDLEAKLDTWTKKGIDNDK